MNLNHIILVIIFIIFSYICIYIDIRFQHVYDSYFFFFKLFFCLYTVPLLQLLLLLWPHIFCFLWWIYKNINSRRKLDHCWSPLSTLMFLCENNIYYFMCHLHLFKNKSTISIFKSPNMKIKSFYLIIITLIFELMVKERKF